MDSKAEEILKKIPKQGFLKISHEDSGNITKKQRIKLMRKGNEFFNQGKIDIAKKIFITTGYTDGLIRLGDYYYKKNQILEAFRMYYLAPYRKKVNMMLEKMAFIIKDMLKEKEE